MGCQFLTCDHDILNYYFDKWASAKFRSQIIISVIISYRYIASADDT